MCCACCQFRVKGRKCRQEVDSKGAPSVATVLLPLCSIGTLQTRALDWTTWVDRKGRVSRGRKQQASVLTSFKWFMWAIGFATIPTCVTAAPVGISELSLLADRLEVMRPDPLSPPTRPPSHNLEETPPPLRQSFFDITAQVQAEALLEATGAVLNPPSLRACILSPETKVRWISILCHA